MLQGPAALHRDQSALGDLAAPAKAVLHPTERSHPLQQSFKVNQLLRSVKRRQSGGPAVRSRREAGHCQSTANRSDHHYHDHETELQLSKQELQEPLVQKYVQPAEQDRQA